MKKFTAMILALMLLCGVLSACGNGNISNDKGGKTTDSPNDAEDIIDDGDMTDNGILDGDKVTIADDVDESTLASITSDSLSFNAYLAQASAGDNALEAYDACFGN